MPFILHAYIPKTRNLAKCLYAYCFRGTRNQKCQNGKYTNIYILHFIFTQFAHFSSLIIWKTFGASSSLSNFPMLFWTLERERERERQEIEYIETQTYTYRVLYMPSSSFCIHILNIRCMYQENTKFLST